MPKPHWSAAMQYLRRDVVPSGAASAQAVAFDEALALEKHDVERDIKLQKGWIWPERSRYPHCYTPPVRRRAPDCSVWCL